MSVSSTQQAKWSSLVGCQLLAIRHDDDLYLETDKGKFVCVAEGD